MRYTTKSFALIPHRNTRARGRVRRSILDRIFTVFTVSQCSKLGTFHALPGRGARP
jgi:hypothetical protein